MTDSGAERAARRIERKYEHVCDCEHILAVHQQGGSCRWFDCKCPKYTNADENISVAAIIREETGTQWIPVGERLPEQGQEVRVWIIDDNSAIGGERLEYEDVWVYDREHPYWAGCNPSHRITHWQPLPAAPDEGGKR